VDKKVRHPDTGEWVDEIPYVKDVKQLDSESILLTMELKE